MVGRLTILFLIIISPASLRAGNDSLSMVWYGQRIAMVRNQLAEGKTDRARALLEPMLNAIRSKEISDSGLVADVFFQEGNICMALSDPPGAVQCYRQGRRFATDPLQVSRIDQNLGAAYFLMDDYRKSRLYLNHAYLTLAEGGYSAPSRLLSVCDDLGAVWFESGDDEKAGTCWKRADLIRSERFPGDRGLEAGIIANLGNISFRRHQWQEASDQYRHAFSLMEKPQGSAGPEPRFLLIHLALALGNQGKTDSALRCLALARTLLPGQLNVNATRLAELERAEGAVYLMAGQYGMALGSFNQGLSLAGSCSGDSTPAHPSYPELYERFKLTRDKAFVLYQYHHGPGGGDPLLLDSLLAALCSGMDALRVLAGITGGDPLLPPRDSATLVFRRAIETGYEAMREDSATWLQGIMRWSGELKSGRTDPGTGNRFHSEPAHDSLNDLLNSLDRRLYYYYKTSLQNSNTSGLPDETLEEQVFRLTLLRDSLISGNGAPGRDPVDGTDPSSLPDRIRAVLRNGEALLDYVISGKFLFILGCTSDTCRIVRVPCGALIAHDVRAFEHALSSSDPELIDSLGTALYRELIDPLHGILKGVSKLILIPDPLMTDFPFECLGSLPPGEGMGLHYLVRDLSITYEISLQDFLDQREGGFVQHTPVYSYFGCAPAFDPLKGPGELQYSREEVEEIAALFRDKGKNVLVSKGTEADEDNFLSGSPSAEIIHLASHSRTDPLHPELSGVFLWKDDPARSDDPLVDGILELGEMGTLRLNCDLLVLSSCALSGDEADPPSDGEARLATRLMNAGARNVLFSLWNVPDKYTAVLMKHFYRFYLSGSTFPEALRKAKLELLKDPATANPFTWGGFVLYGSE